MPSASRLGSASCQIHPESVNPKQRSIGDDGARWFPMLSIGDSSAPNSDLVRDFINREITPQTSRPQVSPKAADLGLHLKGWGLVQRVPCHHLKVSLSELVFAQVYIMIMDISGAMYA